MAAKKKTTKKKASAKGGNRQDAVLREIFGILVITLALISAVAIAIGRGEATTLYSLRAVYVALFGLTAPVVPVLIGLLGAFVIWRNVKIAKLTLHVFLITLLVGAFLTLISPDPGRDIMFNRQVWVRGGGALTEFIIEPMARAISVPGAFLVLIAITAIYAKLALNISYIELGRKYGPHVASAYNTLADAVAQVTESAMEQAREASEKRKERLQAELDRREKEKEQKAQKLKEEEAHRGTQEEASFFDKDEKESNKNEDDSKEKAPDETEEKEFPELVSTADVSIKELEDVDPNFVETKKRDKGSNGDFFVAEMDEDRYSVTVVSSEDDEEKEIVWKLPAPDDWLDENTSAFEGAMDNTMRDKLEATLKDFKVPAHISAVVQGSSFTRFEIELEPGTKVSRIVSLEADIALSLATASNTIRIEAPIPGKSAIGIEIPNKKRGKVLMSDIVRSAEFYKQTTPLTFALGQDIDGKHINASITKMPHLLVAGSTGSGKSVCLNCILSNIIAREYPTEVRLIMVDMKRVELTPYEGIPHLLSPVIQEAGQAANALKWVCSEMDRRYKVFAGVGVRHIDGYNKYVEDPGDRMYRIVVIIDELADLMMVSSSNMNVENHIARIAQLARATGIHLILATQRPDTKVITGTIKNNIPSRIAFKVVSQIDSRTILDQKGSESLLGYGDMLFQPVGANRLKRLQGAYVSDEELKRLVDFWKEQCGEAGIRYELNFDTGEGLSGGTGLVDEFMTEDEKLYHQALEIVVSSQQASISMIQRRLRIGYNRAARLVELMEDRGVVGPHDGSRPREVLTNSMD